MKKTLIGAAAVLVLIGGAGAVLQAQRVNAFVDEIAAAFADNPVDASLVRTAGYPLGFLRAKIDLREFKNQSEAPKFLKGYRRLEVTAHDGITVHEYVYRVGLLPVDDSVILRFDELGKLIGPPQEGPNWR